MKQMRNVQNDHKNKNIKKQKYEITLISNSDPIAKKQRISGHFDGDT